jgi:hypothetical protein
VRTTKPHCRSKHATRPLRESSRDRARTNCKPQASNDAQ